MVLRFEVPANCHQAIIRADTSYPDPEEDLKGRVKCRILYH